MKPEPRITPAPWKLTGSGYILVYKFAQNFVRTQGFIPPFLQGWYRGGLGVVMLVDYHTSDVGAYRELLFIPGRFEIQGKHYYSITKIYVSTMASVVNGRKNWGIPKEIADFDIRHLDDYSERIRVSANGYTFFDTTLISEKLVHLPFNSVWSPFPMTLVQQEDSQLLLTTPRGHGMAQFASVVNMHVDDSRFPDISHWQPLTSVKINSFQIEFPIAHQLKYAHQSEHTTIDTHFYEQPTTYEP